MYLNHKLIHFNIEYCTIILLLLILVLLKLVRKLEKMGT
jgi:hypothetical protein